MGTPIGLHSLAGRGKGREGGGQLLTETGLGAGLSESEKKNLWLSSY